MLSDSRVSTVGPGRGLLAIVNYKSRRYRRTPLAGDASAVAAHQSRPVFIAYQYFVTIRKKLASMLDSRCLDVVYLVLIGAIARRPPVSWSSKPRQ
jgi:hypothetical protein